MTSAAPELARVSSRTTNIMLLSVRAIKYSYNNCLLSSTKILEPTIVASIIYCTVPERILINQPPPVAICIHSILTKINHNSTTVSPQNYIIFQSISAQLLDCFSIKLMKQNNSTYSFLTIRTSCK